MILVESSIFVFSNGPTNWALITVTLRNHAPSFNAACVLLIRTVRPVVVQHDTVGGLIVA